MNACPGPKMAVPTGSPNPWMRSNVVGPTLVPWLGLLVNVSAFAHGDDHALRGVTR